MNIPTSNMDLFKKQIDTPGIGYKSNTVVKVNTPKKNIILSYISDYTGCGHIRNILPSLYLNAIFGKNNSMNIINTPYMIYEDNILSHTRSILFQRMMGPNSIPIIKRYKELQHQYKFKMVYDIDDFIWTGDNEGEDIPEYNFGRDKISNDVKESAIENMKLMDTVCVSTEFLKQYISSKGVNKNNIEVVHNTLPSFLWGSDIKPNIVKRIEKPTILWSASPTHWHNDKKLYGDMSVSWVDWIIKSVKSDKINYVQMGGLPWFFNEIKNKIKIYDWMNSLHYPSTVKSIKADFGISPIVPNYFNYSKSPIKYQEYCVSGIVGVGTTFTNGATSPYDICVTKTPDTVTVDMLDHLFFEYLCLPDNYNRILSEQYKQVIENGWITESPKYINKLTSII